jgi:hypothetical protein
VREKFWRTAKKAARHVPFMATSCCRWMPSPM